MINLILRKNFRILCYFIFLVIISSCSRSQDSITTKNKPIYVEDFQPISIIEEAVIGGSEDADTLASVLGKPVAVITDESGNIYVADKASVSIKIYNQEGIYERSIGGRGRGPGEFYDINFMELTPEGNLLLLDRGNLRYSTISKNGESIDNFSIDLNNQFYFHNVEFVGENIIGMDIRSHVANPQNPSEIFTREIFHVYSRNFQEKYSSFASVKDVGIQNWFGWLILDGRSGTSVYIEDRKEIVFSPGIYTGKLYVYEQVNETDWQLKDSIITTPPSSDPYILYETEAEVQRAFDLKLAGSSKINFSGRSSRGRLLSFDAGIFYLPERKQIVQFYAEWREEEISLYEGLPLNLYAQVINMEGQILASSHIKSMKFNSLARYYDLISWVDKEENFYMIDNSLNEPGIRVFKLDYLE